MRRRSLILNFAGTKASRPGDRRKRLDQFADRERKVEEVREGKLRLDERDRSPSRFGEAIELGFAQTCDGFADIDAPPAPR